MKETAAYEIQRVLQDMRDEYWRGLEAVEEEQQGDAAEYLVLRLGGERFGIATTLAREVLRAPKLVRVPQVPQQIRGVINLRGQVVAVTDLSQVLGLPGSAPAEGGRLVVVEAAGLVTALLTEEVEGIRSIPLATIEPLTEGVAGLPREAVIGQVVDDDGLLVLLNLEQLFTQAQFIVEQKGE